MAKVKTYKVRALVNIKYDKTVVNTGKEFKVRKSDIDELVSNGYVEVLDEINENDGPKDEDRDTGEKEGEE
ncbi:hypothetical protein ABHA37_08180 [Clostridium tertium]|uniref:DUF7210 family protein n=1 Tax=Clostridium tertium TaxID=1559 RepID=UPI00232D898F|nr:hypothetical protein [Clostridium tertium]MDB1923390.1 hypothetical protein [Clostridium tertium]MDB1929995.1 hypothetical protein [Clostridium tertium]